MQKIEMAFSEVYEIFHFLDRELIEKIPLSVRKLIEDERDKDYKVILNPNLSLEEQNLLVETYNILGVLKLKYWCENELEKQKMVSIANKNEVKYEEFIREKYNPDNIFKDKSNLKQNVNTTETMAIVEYKENFWKKLINKIKCFFKR